MNEVKLTETIFYDHGTFKHLDKDTKKFTDVEVMPLIDCPMVEFPSIHLALVAMAPEEDLFSEEPRITVDAVWLGDDDLIFLKKICVGSKDEERFKLYEIFKQGGVSHHRDFHFNPLMMALLAGHPVIEELFFEARAFCRENLLKAKEMVENRSHDWSVFTSETAFAAKYGLEKALQSWIKNADSASHYVSQFSFPNQLHYQVQNIQYDDEDVLVTVAESNTRNRFLLFVPNKGETSEIERVIMNFDSDKDTKAFYFHRSLNTDPMYYDRSKCKLLNAVLEGFIFYMNFDTPDHMLWLSESDHPFWFESRFCRVPSLRATEPNQACEAETLDDFVDQEE